MSADSRAAGPRTPPAEQGGAARTRRGTELAMLLFAITIAMVAYVAVGLAQSQELSPGQASTQASTQAPALDASVLVYGGGLVLLFGIAHVVVRRVAPYADPLLLPGVALLNSIGLVLIHRLDLAEAQQAQHARELGEQVLAGDARLQLLWTLVGLALFVAVLLIVRDHRMLSRYTYTAMAAGLILLALPAVLPTGISEVHGAKIWIRVGGMSIQPGEFAKLLLIIFFAGYLVVKRDVLALASRRLLGLDLPRGRDMGPVLLAWGASLLVLVFEQDLGTSLLFFGVFVAMLYVATERLSWLLLGLSLFVIGSVTAYSLFDHVRDRVAIWLHPFSPDLIHHESYQLVQGLFGLASGGLIGTGLGQGQPDVVPYAKTDFILATLGEELGLVGLMAIFVIYALIIERGLRAALAVRDSFGKLLAAGLAFSLGFQVFVVAGGVTRLIPLTGLTTPFLSYGGSSLVANYALIALLLRVSDGARRPVPTLSTPRGWEVAGVPVDNATGAATEVIRR